MAASSTRVSQLPSRVSVRSSIKPWSFWIVPRWACVLSFTQIINALPTAAFAWLLAGGIIYTIGGVIYALKLKVFNANHKYFGSHEIFHLFVMAGSICHFIMMFNYVAVMPLK